jgi:NADPH:quinone reductase-like Zn-dependent oxidoreductase
MEHLSNSAALACGKLNLRSLFMGLALLVTASACLAATPAQMQAMVSTSAGSLDLKLEGVPVPQPAAGEVLIRIYAASVNPVDWKALMGPQRGVADVARIPGRDVAGVIEKVGPGVTQFKAGEAVYGEVAPLPSAPVNGAYAHYAVAPVSEIAPKPRRMSYAEASGLGIATVTGVRAVQHAGVAPGQRVLVTGAAGGVGSAAVQAAKARGAHVIGTAAARHATYLRSIGLDEYVDYTAGDWAGHIADVDVVIDTVSADNATQALRTMKRGGKLIFIAGRPEAAACTAAGVECQGGALGQMSVPEPAGPGGVGTGAGSSAGVGGNPVVEEILKLANAGKLRIVIDASYPLANARAALEASHKGGTQGKIVLIVDAARASSR